MQATKKHIVVYEAIQENENGEEYDEVDSLHTVFTSGSARCGCLLVVLSFHESFEKLDLCCMVYVVRCDACQDHRVINGAPARNMLQIVRTDPCNGFAQRLMALLHQPNVISPLHFRESPCSSEPIAALQRKRTAFLSQDSTPHSVLPISTMHDNFPDTMSAGGRTPQCLTCGQTAD